MVSGGVSSRGKTEIYKVDPPPNPKTHKRTVTQKYYCDSLLGKNILPNARKLYPENVIFLIQAHSPKSFKKFLKCVK
jgi:hypothetical protein